MSQADSTDCNLWNHSHGNCYIMFNGKCSVLVDISEEPTMSAWQKKSNANVVRDSSG